jgi:hypothetical protein
MSNPATTFDHDHKNPTVKRLPLAVALPLVAWIVSILALVAPIAVTYVNLRHADVGSDRISVTTANGAVFTFPRDSLPSLAVHFGVSRTSSYVRALNFSGFLGEVVLSVVMRADGAVWHPRSFLFEDWEAVSFPLFSLPFWWLAGRGLDTVRGTEASRTWLVPLGTVLWILMSVLFLGMRFGLSPSERFESDISWVLWGSAFWALLFGVFPLIAVLRFRKRQRA